MRSIMSRILITAISGTLLASGEVPQAPVAPRRDHVQLWHGEKVNDPWFWLREKDSPEVLDYLKAENAYTEAVTEELKPFSEILYKEMLSRIKQTDLDVPVRIGHFYYYTRTVEGQQYPIYCRKTAAADFTLNEKAPEEVLLDQNALAKGLKFISLGSHAVSDDASRMLYTTDVTGFRQYHLYFKDLATRVVQGPLAERVTSLAWAGDNATVFYVTENAVTKRSDTLWRLKLGGKPEKLWEEKDELFAIEIERTKDKRYLVLASTSTDSWEMRILDASAPSQPFKVVLPREKGHKYDLEHRDGLLYIRPTRGPRTSGWSPPRFPIPPCGRSSCRIGRTPSWRAWSCSMITPWPTRSARP